MSKFQEELAARRAAQATEQATEKKAVTSVGAELLGIYGNGNGQANNWYGKSEPSQAPAQVAEKVPDWESLVPDVPQFERTAYDDQLDSIIQNLPITQAYRRWIPKGEPEIRYEGQTESIKIRCPFPHHEDNDPSAWCNTIKGTWYCNPCDYGGDIYDLAAIRFGLPVPQYKKNGMFPKLRQMMAADFGLQVVRGINGQEYVVGADEDGTTPPAGLATPTTESPRVPHKPTRTFQIPGFTSVPMPGSVAVQQTPAAPQVPAAPPAPPAQPTPSGPVAAPQPTPAPASPSSGTPGTDATEEETQDTVPTAAIPHQAAAPSFNIPGFTPVSFGTATQPGASFATNLIPNQVPQPAQPMTAQAPTMLSPGGFGAHAPVATIKVVEPDKDTLAQYGLNAEGDEDGSGGFVGINLPWETLTPSDTFLERYMRLTTRDEAPEEFHYFSGMLALSMATGQSVRLFDRHPVKANIFVCLLGKTGEGKSNAKGYLNQLLAKAMPYDHDDPVNQGVRRVGNPGSSEFMVKQFMKQIKDPNNPGLPAEKVPVRGLIEFEELATLMKRSNSPSSTLAQFLIEFYDAKGDVQTGSLTHGGFVATDPFASTLSTTQPRALRDIITGEHVSSGFLNRWIFATGKAKQIDPIGGEVIDVDPLVLPLQRVFAWTTGINNVIQWEPAAFRLASDFIVDVIRPLKQSDETDLYARIDLMFKKFILLNTVNLQRTAAPAEAVQWSIGAFNYLIDTYRSLDKAVHHNVDEELRQAVMKSILSLTAKNKRPPSMSQIIEKVGSKRFAVDQIMRCVQTLEKVGILTELPPDRGPGRKTTRFAITAAD